MVRRSHWKKNSCKVSYSSVPWELWWPSKIGFFPRVIDWEKSEIKKTFFFSQHAACTRIVDVKFCRHSASLEPLTLGYGMHNEIKKCLKSRRLCIMFFWNTSSSSCRKLILIRELVLYNYFLWCIMIKLASKILKINNVDLKKEFIIF